MEKLAIPSSLRALLMGSRPRSPRDRALLDLAVLNGFRASEIAAVDFDDVDLKQRRIQRHGRKSNYWQPLLVTEPAVWEALMASASPNQKALFTSSRNNRLSRIDIWRVLRAIGEQEKQKKPLTTRRLRNVLAGIIAKKHNQPASTTAAVLGVKHLNSVQRFHLSPDWSEYPSE